jgi:hypothetical protein
MYLRAATLGGWAGPGRGPKAGPGVCREKGLKARGRPHSQALMLHSRHVSMQPKNTTYADTVTEAKLMATMLTSRHKMPVVMRSAPLHIFTILRVRVNLAVDQSRIVVRGALGSAAALGSRVDSVASGADIGGWEGEGLECSHDTPVRRGPGSVFYPHSLTLQSLCPKTAHTSPCSKKKLC